eukprot:TRINITY_DN52289_c0_g1_i1.p1 TRINITY_DN52289_c0_g1~~TRINITY_DN52289_c0_g1_i1.p1  ORF type:complete len:486 (-),score=43.55 TRINITY_DN52289_c0_g1_i1:97-1554(-)
MKSKQSSKKRPLGDVNTSIVESVSHHHRSEKRVKGGGTSESETPAAAAVAAFIREHDITFHDAGTEDSDFPLCCISFDKAPFPTQIKKMLFAQFKVPSPIQAASWGLAAAGRDVLAIAKTGSGKTLAFLLPAIAKCDREKADRDKGSSSPICLIMAPTRELATQICSEAVKFGQQSMLGCRAVAIYGGAPKSAQVSALRKGCELIVATPGRMKDMLDIRGNGYSAETDLEQCSMLILDEADRMLDMGFEKEIRDIVWQIPSSTAHQTLMYSATWPTEIQQIASELLTNPAMVTVGRGGEKLTANKSVTQNIHVVGGGQCKLDELVKLLETFRAPNGSDCKKKLIIFANMKKDVKWLTNHCRKLGFNVDCISGDRTQSQREDVLKRFRDGTLKIVVATDVCGRGLDIEGIDRVINYDFPGPEDYIHRIGRTGRAGKKGRADSFFTESDKLHAKELIRILTDAGQVIPPALGKLTSQSVQFSDSDSE